MSDAKPAGNDIRRVFAVQELHRTIDYALHRCLSVREIAERLLAREDDLDTTDVDTLLEMALAEADRGVLLKAVARLAARSETAPSRLKARIDRTILRILRLLPSEMSAPFAKQYLGHRLKSRRKWAYSAFRDVLISHEVSETLVAVFREHGDQEALQLIARNPAQVVATGPEFLLENLQEEYWRARVVEAALVEHRRAAIHLADRYPFEFAHAVGRLEDRRLLRVLCRLFPSNCSSVEFLSIYAYALGKLKATTQLNALREYVESTFGAA
jgi:hypothetical protein